MTGSVLRNLLRSSFSDVLAYLDNNDATRNAMFGYCFGRLRITGGDANSIVATLLHPTGLTALQDGAWGWFVPEEDNTGPMELNVGTGLVPFRDRGGSAFSGGEVKADQVTPIVYYDNGTDPVEFRLLGTAGGQATRPLGIRLITATGTYVPTTGTTHVWAIGQAAGGGGGGLSTNPSMGGMGAPGETRLGIFEIADDVEVTVGAPGTAGSGGAGGDGGDLVFGALMTCKGGTAGAVGDGSPPGADGSTPTGSGGIRLEPCTGNKRYDQPLDVLYQRPGGTLLGEGGFEFISGGSLAAQPGVAPSGYGAGGMGGFANGGSNPDGSAGGPAALLLIEFGQ